MEDQTVKLFHPLKGIRVFGKQHAQNIMDIPEMERGGWQWYEEPKAKAAKKSNVDADDSTGKGSDQGSGAVKGDDQPVG